MNITFGNVMTEYCITDKEVNDIINELLDWESDKRLDSRGAWAYMFDKAMIQWDEMHPDTRPPAYLKVGPPPACFNGTLPPIYDGELGNETVACKQGTYKV
jgi:hypothetical protein